jgi:hypothetical protein
MDNDALNDVRERLKCLMFKSYQVKIEKNIIIK